MPRPAVGQAGDGVALFASMASLEIASDKFAVVIDLEHNRLHFRKGGAVLWSAIIGTGTGLTLREGDDEWDFSTPRGEFQVQFKEINPTWVVPDWHFIEQGVPVPPPNHPSRRIPGGLGAAAVYLGHDLAIHGTDKPELLGQRVSHGCIRMSNRDVMRLFHNVQVGTPIYVVGEPKAPTPEPAARRGGNAARRPATVADPRLKQPTSELLQRLDDELWDAAGDGAADWPATASVLLDRGLEGDAAALRGMLGLATSAARDDTEWEFRTFTADAFSRGARPVLDALGTMPRSDRARVARAIIDGTLALFPGTLADPRLPWPSDRLHPGQLSSRERRGLEALRSAEEPHRERAQAAT